MESNTTRKNLKWRTPGDPTRFRLHYPPARSPRKTEHWDNWTRSMMLDARLTSAHRCILVAVALHYNLETGDCFPAHGRVSVEAGLGEIDTGSKAVQRAVSKAVKLGWIKRTSRYGGSHKKSQTNLYDLTLPPSIQAVRSDDGPKLAVVEAGDGKWQIIQLSDGMVVCGPFNERANAETWVAEHGPRGQIAQPRGQNRGTEGTLAPPITGKYQNREVIEHSVSSIQLRSLSRDVAHETLQKEIFGRKGEFEGKCAAPPRIPNEESWRGYTDDEVERVREIIECYGLTTIGSVVACARKFRDNFITGKVIGMMCRDGHFGREGDEIFLLDEKAE